jgi:type I restriction enzyme S subunit
VNDGLPTGWAAATLGEIAVLNPRSFTSEPADDDIVSFVPMAAVEEESGRLDASRGRPWAEVSKGYTRFEENDVLMAKITPCMENGKYAVAQRLIGERGTGSTEFHVLRPTPGVSPHLLLYFLFQMDVRRAARLKMKGAAGQLRVPPEFLSELTFNLPPSPEQERIVAEIEKQFTRLDAAVAALKRVQANLKRYRAAVLKAACEGCLVLTEAELARREGHSYETGEQLLARILEERRARWESDQLAKMVAAGKPPHNDEWRKKYKEPETPDTSGLPQLPGGWTWASLAQLSEIQGGIQKQPKRAPRSNAFPYLRVANVYRGRLDLSEIEYMELFGEELEKLRLQTGDLLIVEGNGSPSEIGRMAIWRGEIANCVHQNHIIRARLIGGTVPIFFASYWNSPMGSGEVLRLAGSTSGLFTLSVSKVGRLPIPLAPLEEQIRIVAELELRLSRLAAMEISAAHNSVRADRLRQSILMRAFEGRLVPQDPNDEPASALLERNKAARLLTKSKPSPRSRNRQTKETAMAKPERVTPIVEVLRERKTPSSPEQLFNGAGYTVDTIDEFYADLKSGIDGGHILETRSADDTILLQARRIEN